MWIFNWTGKKKKAPLCEERDRVLDLANTLPGEGSDLHLELERRLGEFDLSSLSGREQESWWHLYGLTAFQTGRDTEALSRFEEGCRRFPHCAHLRFSLGQQYIRTGKIEDGFGLFRECRFPEVPREYTLMQTRYAYLWSRYDDGMFFIEPFLEAYRRLKVLDDHYLYVRGLPFFGCYWGYLASFSILGDKVQELERITKLVSRKCYECDFEYLQRKMIAYRDDKPELLLEPLEQQLARASGKSPQHAYTLLNIAVIKARGVADLESAKKILGEVKLAERDRLLHDIRVVALAECAHRFGDSKEEEARVDAFLARHPILLEPDVALSFHLLKYQQRLKMGYQAATLAGHKPEIPNS